MDRPIERPLAPPAPDVYTVSRLNHEVKVLLDGSFPLLWVEGEVSNLARPASGHIYFNLKDAHAQIRCALFRGQARLLRFALKDGMHVVTRARASLYEGRGEFQLIVEQLEDGGEGALRRAFEALKTRLAREGLFDVAGKRALPRLPRRIGVITSPTGAVLRDIVTTLKRRFAAVPVRLYPVPVQGAGAAEKIAAALALAGTRADCDVLILARGGGSLEDLWAFNEEIVARAIHACPIPVVCGIGHETDVTIADLAADVRAPTPTAAAELVTPAASEWLERFDQLAARLLRRMRDDVRARAQTVDWLVARLTHPRHRIALLASRRQALADRLAHACRDHLHRAHRSLAQLAARFERATPRPRLDAAGLHGRHLHTRLERAMTLSLQRAGERLGRCAQTLHALSPIATLARGYAIAADPTTGKILRDAGSVAKGAAIDVRLARGSLICIVKNIL